MSVTAFTNISSLVTNNEEVDNGLLGLIKGPTVLVEDGLVLAIEKKVPSGVDAIVDCSGKTLIPGFVDSHTHAIFAGDRADEFAARARGEKYSAGGIRTTVSATRLATSEDLARHTKVLLNEAFSYGTTTVEIKTGYGLTVEDEIRIGDIAAQFTDEVTLLAAHVIPQEFATDPDGYVSLIINEILPRTSAKWIDVFCDTGAFTVEQTRRLFEAAQSFNLIPRIHANQLERSEAVAVAIEFGAASADHLAQCSDSDIQALASSATVATLLPAAEFSTHHVAGLGRRFLDAGAKVAIATDCNPGSSFNTSMPFCIATAVSLLGFTVEEALYAATQGGAQALQRVDIGRIAPGYRADFALLETPSYIHLAYRPGLNIVHSTYKSGRAVTQWQK